MDFKELIKRNMPVFVIGGLTLLVFIGIIISASGRGNDSTKLKQVDEAELLAPHMYLKGPSTAKVAIVEFTDFGCPACKALHPVVLDVYNKFPNHIKYGVRHFPLPQHKDADKAAVAAQVAGEQGAFWEYADMLFEFQGQFKEEDLVRYADLLGLDLNKFREGLKDDSYKAIVDQDVRLGKKINVNATPTFFVNGRKVTIQEEGDLLIAVRRAFNELGIDPSDIETEEEAKIREAEKAVIDNMHKLIDETSGVVEIEYTEEGFTPRSIDVNAGQLVKWTNTTEEDIKLVQLMPKYQALSEPTTIKAGESFEFRMELREKGMWTYKEENNEQVAKINIQALSDNVKRELP